MRIALAADHAGYQLKDELATWLREAGHEITDLGTNGPESVDYPQYGARLAAEVASGRAERGIAVCGSGIGISIAPNAERRFEKWLCVLGKVCGALISNRLRDCLTRPGPQSRPQPYRRT